VFQGRFAEILKCDRSITGQYLAGKEEGAARRRPVRLGTTEPPVRSAYDTPTSTSVLNKAPFPAYGSETCASLHLSGARLHNLKNLSVQIPLTRFVCVTGVSGSGKTTLIREALLPALTERLGADLATVKASARLDDESNEQGADENGSGDQAATGVGIDGWETLGRVVLVDQTTLGKTPRSNPAVYTGAFDDIRELFAQSDLAKQRGLNASSFSFNSSQGQCERCRGAGFEKIEMQFLSDIFIRCPDCDGRRYRSHILEIKIRPAQKKEASRGSSPAMSIADLLDATVDEAVQFLEAFPKSRPARRATDRLKLLQETGLGYLKLGQPINTLSGGESQRLKLVKHLAASDAVAENTAAQDGQDEPDSQFVPTLFLFDEPTTGLHFDDVRVLLKVFHRLVDAGHSVVVIEHNLDVVQSADWIIDLGPEAGDLGGRLVAQGTPEQIAQCEDSHTGQALRDQFRNQTESHGGKIVRRVIEPELASDSESLLTSRKPRWDRSRAAR
jgi:excinuclease ABC subunit A